MATMTKAASRHRRRLTRAHRNIKWIEDHCYVPDGKFVGQKMRLRQFQKDEIVKIYDNPHGPTRRAIISFGRKNAKTTLAACLLLLHLVGPEYRPHGQLFSAAQSREQAALLYSLAMKMVTMSPTLNSLVECKETAKKLICPAFGTIYRALSAEAATAYGLSPVFIVHDELGQVKGPRSELYEALETATAAQEEPLSIVISTQAPTDADLLSILIDDALKESDHRTVVSLHTAPLEMDPFSDEAMRAANPAFGDFMNAVEVRGMAEDARRMPAREAEYRNLVLNQRVEMSSPFISRSVWMSCAGEVAESFRGVPVYAGLDLSEVSDLTALVLVANIGGLWHVRPTFWLPDEGLAEKARKDRVPYDVWARDGFLETTPGKSIEYEYVAHRLRSVAMECDLKQVAFDRYNFKHLKPWLLRAGFTEPTIETMFVEFGQGYVSMSPALRETESLLLSGKIAHEAHPVLTMCAANAVVQRDPAGNRKLTKDRSRGRIDGMVAMSMALSVAQTHSEKPAGNFQMMWV